MWLLRYISQEMGVRFRGGCAEYWYGPDAFVPIAAEDDGDDDDEEEDDDADDNDDDDDDDDDDTRDGAFCSCLVKL
jgi:hypothetical protein